MSLPCRSYPERLIITRPVSIQAAPDEAVELTWQSSEPYQSTIEVDASVYPELAEPTAVLLQGLRVRHSSPSIANNYAVRLVVSRDAVPSARRREARLLLPVAVHCSPLSCCKLAGNDRARLLLRKKRPPARVVL